MLLVCRSCDFHNYTGFRWRAVQSRCERRVKQKVKQLRCRTKPFLLLRGDEERLVFASWLPKAVSGSEPTIDD